MDYSTPFVVKNEFQNTQKQTAWLVGEVVDNKKLLVQTHQDLEQFVMDMVIFRTIFFELLVFFTFTLLIFYFAY